MIRTYTLIRSDRRSLGLQVKNGQLIVRAPRNMKKEQIESFIALKEKWIESHMQAQLQRIAAHPEPDRGQIEQLKKRAELHLKARVEYYSALTGLRPAGVKISGAKTRFGSCSSKGSINFSWRLMDYPPEAVDYVVLHELCHLKHMNHGREFYGLVERYMPDWKRRRELLKK